MGEMMRVQNEVAKVSDAEILNHVSTPVMSLYVTP